MKQQVQYSNVYKSSLQLTSHTLGLQECAISLVKVDYSIPIYFMLNYRQESELKRKGKAELNIEQKNIHKFNYISFCLKVIELTWNNPIYQ